MNKLRSFTSVLALFALGALFLKLPEMARLLNCKGCFSFDPYLPLIGAGYFSLLAALSFLFPTFPGPKVAKGGLVWALLLFLTLTYIEFPHLCLICLICHTCNILIWAVWIFVPANKEIQVPLFREKLYLLLFTPVATIALFSCLNLTIMAYGFNLNRAIGASSLKIGDSIPAFTAKTNSGLTIVNTKKEPVKEIVINFVAPDCPFCKEQLAILREISDEAQKSYRFINISPVLPQELTQLVPEAEWVEDNEGTLRNLFKVSGYPTIFIAGSDGKFSMVLPGVPEKLRALLIASLQTK